MALLKRGKIWHVRKMVGSVLIAKSTKSTNKRTAEALEAKWTAEVHAEVVVAGNKPLTVKQACHLYLESRRGTAGHINAGYRLGEFKKLYPKNLHDVTKEEVTRVLKDLLVDKTALSTINVCISYWNAVQNYCNENGYSTGAKVKSLKGDKTAIRFMSDAEVGKLLNHIHPNNVKARYKAQATDNHDYTVMLLNTGARDKEVATLKMSQIDLVANTLTIKRSKGGTDTTFTMSNAMREIVDRRVAATVTASLLGCVANGFLFPAKNKGKTTSNKFFRAACDKLDMPEVHIHCTRHTFAAQMLKAGLSIVEVQHLLGHRNIKSTLVYTSCVPNLTASRAAQVLNAQATAAATV